MKVINQIINTEIIVTKNFIMIATSKKTLILVSYFLFTLSSYNQIKRMVWRFIYCLQIVMLCSSDDSEFLFDSTTRVGFRIEPPTEWQVRGQRNDGALSVILHALLSLWIPSVILNTLRHSEYPPSFWTWFRIPIVMLCNSRDSEFLFDSTTRLGFRIKWPTEWQVRDQQNYWFEVNGMTTLCPLCCTLCCHSEYPRHSEYPPSFWTWFRIPIVMLHALLSLWIPSVILNTLRHSELDSNADRLS
jgi:hypothetical protein